MKIRIHVWHKSNRLRVVVARSWTTALRVIAQYPEARVDVRPSDWTTNAHVVIDTK